MSQEKVDKYKKDKANRRKNIAKEKRKRLIGKIVGIVVGVAFLVYIVWSVTVLVKPEKEKTGNTMSEEDLSSYLKELEEIYGTTTAAEGTTTPADEETTKGDGTTTTGDESVTTSADASAQETTTVAQ